MDIIALTLESPAPLDDKLRKYNFLYLLCFAVGSVIGPLTDSPWYVMGIIFLIPAYIMKSIIATRLVYSLNKNSYVTPKLLPGKEMAGLITIPLTQLGMEVTVVGDEAVVNFKSMQYYIRNYDDGTFGIVFDQVLGSRLLSGRRYISQYKKSIIAIGLIAYTVQNEIKKITTEIEVKADEA